MWLCLLPPRAVVASRAVERRTAHLQTLSVFHRSHSTHRIWLSPLSILPIVRCLFSLPYIFFVVNQTPVLFRTSFPSPFLFFSHCNYATFVQASKLEKIPAFAVNTQPFLFTTPTSCFFPFRIIVLSQHTFSCLALQFFPPSPCILHWSSTRFISVSCYLFRLTGRCLPFLPIFLSSKASPPVLSFNVFQFTCCNSNVTFVSLPSLLSDSAIASHAEQSKPFVHFLLCCRN